MKPDDQKPGQCDAPAQSTGRVYLDICALCHPYDDQSAIRIRLETEAVQLVLSHVRTGDLTLVVSPVHAGEIGAITDPVEREHLFSALRRIGRSVEVDLHWSRERAEWLADQGLGVADAAHLASAEAMGADFVSCDDRLLRQCSSVPSNTWSGTPVAFCEKEELK